MRRTMVVSHHGQEELTMTAHHQRHEAESIVAQKKTDADTATFTHGL